MSNHKKRKLEKWIEETPSYKRRLYKYAAESIYDSIYKEPNVETVLSLTGANFKQKCNLVKQIEMLSHYTKGSEDYFDTVDIINRQIDNYKSLVFPVDLLKDNLPTISMVVGSDAPHSEKRIMASKLDQMYNHIPSSDIFINNKKFIEDKLNSYMDYENKENGSDIPLRIKIDNACLSEHNKSVILNKLSKLDRMSPFDSSYNKLQEWIEYALTISDRIVTLSNNPIEEYLYNVRNYLDRNLYGMNNAKEKLIEITACKLVHSNTTDMSICLAGPPGVGKCLHPDTQLLMYLGGMKAVKDVKRGDILLGDDSTPRIVRSVTTGVELMYKISPEYSEPFIVNESHMLTLHNEYTNTTIDISLKEYLTKSDIWKVKHKMYLVPVEYSSSDIKNDPYLVGILLNGKCKFNSTDEVVKEYLTRRLDNLSSYINGLSDAKSINVTFIDKEEISYLLDHRYIPDSYIYNNREIRYKLLKGFIESENKKSEVKSAKSGSARSRSQSVTKTPNFQSKSSLKHRRAHTPGIRHNHDTTKSKIPIYKRSSMIGSKKASPNNKVSNVSNSSSFTSNSSSSVVSNVGGSSSSVVSNVGGSSSSNSRQSRLEEFRSNHLQSLSVVTKILIEDPILGEQIKFLSRSIGFKATYENNNLIIYGDLNVYPNFNTKIETSFHVTQLTPDKYCGFTLDGNGRFLLASCLVTHNTHIVEVYAKALGYPFSKINMGGSTDSHHFLGHSYTYEGSNPGIIVKTLGEMKDDHGVRFKSGIIFLDEFDKIGKNTKVSQAFLHISDPLQQKSFTDQYMPEIKIDLSHITFAYSVNNVEFLDNTLLDRMHVIKLAGYNNKEKYHILSDYIIPAALKNIGLSNEVKFADSALNEIISSCSIDDSKGMRKCKHIIQNIVNKINVLKCVNSESLVSYSIIGFKLPIVIDVGILHKLKVLPESETSYLSMYQ
jgi:hypothetical protein